MSSLANELTLRSFLNSFLRDYAAHHKVEDSKDAFCVRTRVRDFKINYKEKSSLGFHSYEFLEDLHFEGFVRAICDEFCEGADSNEIVSKIINSRDNLASLLEYHPHHKVNDYISSEGSLLLGHPFHPFPKAKWGMSEEDLVKFAPEFQGKFHFVYASVDESLLKSNLSASQLKRELQELYEFEGLKSDSLLLPFHPWQWERISKRGLTKRGEGKNEWSALSSMRSYFHPLAPLQVKSSLSLTITNSLRHLNEKELKRGSELEQIIVGEEANSLLECLNEPFYAGLCDEEGRFSEETSLQFRAPFKAGMQPENTFLLSSYLEVHPLDHRSCALSDIEELSKLFEGNLKAARKEWFSSFLKHILAPFMDLAHQKGILLGAHLQNIIIQTEDHRPVKAIYRDFQGSGVTSELYEKGRYDFLDPENGNILDEKSVNKVFGYYLIVNSGFGVIAQVARGKASVEEEMLIDLRTFLYKRKKEDSFAHFLLESPVLYQKGNMRCALVGMNENSAQDPWSIYNEIPNPLCGLRELKKPRSGILYETDLKRGAKLKIRKLELSDLSLFHSWHHKDYVKEFWELDKTRDELEAYITSLHQSPYQLPVIVEINDEPMGYYELYWAHEDRLAPYAPTEAYDRGLHLLIGEEKFLRTRYVYDSMLHVTQFLFEEDERTKAVWAEPRADNTKLVRFCEKLPGWNFIKEFNFPHKRSMLLKCDRESFFKEYANAL